MNLQRQHAILLLSFRDLIILNEVGREEILIDELSSRDIDTSDISDFNNEKYNDIIINYIKDSYKGVLNSYIECEVSKLFQKKIKVLGESESLYKCLCCNYHTLDLRGEYSICKVCYWEDDGTDDDEKFSSVNRLTLKEAKTNFSQIGAIEQRLLNYIQPNVISMFKKGSE